MNNNHILNKSDTLAKLIRSKHVSFNQLNNKYAPLLNLVKELIGVIPNCDAVLEMWPVAFRTYNLLVPNLLSIQRLMFSGKRMRSTIGLAVYSASRAAQCAYCTAHTCSFALRRGASMEDLAGEGSEEKRSIILFAESVAQIPNRLTKAQVEQVRKYFNKDEVQHIALSIALMGFLNKFMDAMGIKLEQKSIQEVGHLLRDSGWAPGKHLPDNFKPEPFISINPDTVGTYIRIIKNIPRALAMERQWLKEIPGDYHSLSGYLTKHVGYHFPMIQKIASHKVRRVIGASLRDNLDAQQSIIGLKIKLRVGILYSLAVQNEILLVELQEMIFHSKHIKPSIDVKEFIDATRNLLFRETPFSVEEYYLQINVFRPLGVSDEEIRLLMIARAASTSPAEINEVIIQEAAIHIRPEEIVETMAWISLLQCLHRLYSFLQFV